MSDNSKQCYNPNGAIIYRGPSLLDGSPIVVVVTGLAAGSANGKTGAMLQTWILRDDSTAPHEHVRAGTDGSICGGCPFRAGAGCYVATFQGPRAVWDAVRRGRYVDVSGDAVAIAELGRARLVRLGSYGDPLAAPFSVWNALVTSSVGHTGYTHQWRMSRADARFRTLVQASCETPEDVRRAVAGGWGVFAVVTPEVEALLPGNVTHCPASAERDHAATCAECLMCDGASGRIVAIAPHGAKSRRAADVSRRALVVLT